MSNRTAQAGDAAVDPLEPLLYKLFLASTTRLPMSDVAAMLGVPVAPLLRAASVAVRLGFAERLPLGSSSQGVWRLLVVGRGAAAAASGLPPIKRVMTNCHQSIV